MLISYLLLILTIFSFIFYGVVGKEKIWLMAPALFFNYVLVFIWGCLKLQLSNKNKEIKLPIIFPKDFIFWALFLIYGIFITQFSSIPFNSRMELLYVGGILGSFLVWRNELNSFTKNKTILLVSIISVLLCSVYGLIIHFKSPEQILWLERYTDAYQGRLRSTYICPNHFAHLLQLLIPFCIVIIFLKESKLSAKALCIYSLVIFFPVLFFTESRAAWLGTIIACGTLLCLFTLRKNFRLFFLVIVIIFLFFSTLVFYAWNNSETFHRRMSPVVEYIINVKNNGLASESKDFRPQTWADTIVMISDSPLIGHGPGGYRYTFPKYRDSFSEARVVTGHPHNEYLELLSDYGIIGFIIFSFAWCSTFFILIKNSFKAKSFRHSFIGFASISSLLGTMVHSFFDFQMHIYPNAMMTAFLIAISLSPLEKESRKNVKKLYPNYLCYFILILFLIGLVFSFKVLGSDLLRATYDRSFTSSKNKKILSFDHINKSIYLDVENWNSYNSMGLFYYHHRYFSLEIEDKLNIGEMEIENFRKAYQYNPYHPEICMSLGKICTFLGQKYEDQKLIDEGIEYIYQACEYRKFNNLYWWELATELRKIKRYSESLEVFNYIYEKFRLDTNRYVKDELFKESVNKNKEWLNKNLKNIYEKSSNNLIKYNRNLFLDMYKNRKASDVLKKIKKASNE